MMKFAKRAALVLSLLLTVVSAAPALAQNQELAPEHLALAREYVDLTDKANVYERALIEIGINTMRILLQQNPDLGDPVDDAIGKVVGEYKDRKGDLLDQFARLYALRFTQEELQQIVDFYASPLGQKLATTNAELTQDMQSVMEVFQNNLNDEFFAKVRAELKAAGYEL
jgi:uncharacterized protein